jgi:hypothetical protein
MSNTKSVGIAFSDPLLDGASVVQGAVTAKTTAVTLTPADLRSGIITATQSSGATVAYTLPTGTVMDLSGTIQVNEAFDWTLINLSAEAADTITVTAGTNHSIVGVPICASVHSSTGGAGDGSSSRWRTRKTAPNTFVTYRIG